MERDLVIEDHRKNVENSGKAYKICEKCRQVRWVISKAANIFRGVAQVYVFSLTSPKVHVDGMPMAVTAGKTQEINVGEYTVSGLMFPDAF